MAGAPIWSRRQLNNLKLARELLAKSRYEVRSAAAKGQQVLQVFHARSILNPAAPESPQ